MSDDMVMTCKYCGFCLVAAGPRQCCRAGQDVDSLAADLARVTAELAETKRAMRIVQSAAKTGMDAAHTTSNHRLERAAKLEAESRPEVIDSERNANAILTAELERATAERDEAHKLLARRVDADRLSEANEKLAAAEAARDRAREALDALMFEAKVYAAHNKLEPLAQRMYDIAEAALAPAQDESTTRIRHAVTCKLFPDPHDEREPVGPCTCRYGADGRQATDPRCNSHMSELRDDAAKGGA